MYPKQPAVYQLTHKSTGHFYIGSTNNLDRRIRRHRNDLEAGEHHSHKFEKAFGDWSCVRVTYQTFSTEEQAKDEEERLLKLHISDPLCCNIGTGARSLWGNGRPQEVTEKISRAQRGKPVTDEFRENARQRMLGTTMSEEQKRKISDSLKGKVVSDETRQKLSEARKGVSTGPRSAESELKRKATIAAKGGFKHTDESRQAIADANKKAVMVDGVEYGSLQEAAKSLGVSQSTITNRINSKNPKFSGYEFK